MAYVPSSEQETLFLENYDPGQYKNPAVAADTALFALCGETLRLLLIRRGNYPFKGCWALPGGFVGVEEDILEAARRELKEETGLSGFYMEQVFCWGKPGRDPRQRVITLSYVAMADSASLKPCAGDDAAQAEWFDFSDFMTREEPDTTVISYTLRGRRDTLRPVVCCPKGHVQQLSPVDTGGLAFDHAESIAYSYLYLQQRMHSGFLDLAFENDEARQRARRALSRHCHDTP